MHILSMNGSRDPREARLVDWLRGWMRHGADLSIPVQELRSRGVPDDVIVRALEIARPKGNALEGGAMQNLPLIRRAPPGLRRIHGADFPLFTLDDFLTPEECAALVDLSGAHLKPSPLTRSHYDSQYRTSSTANLFEIDDPRARDVDDRICRTLGIRSAYSEGIQIQRYEVGQQFKPHLDCFEPGTNTFQRYAGVRGNRTWTFMVYLNDAMEGGGTNFPLIDLSVRPRTGMALFWNNLHDDGSPNLKTRHAGEPVRSGHKVIITKWFRVHGDGPILHESFDL